MAMSPSEMSIFAAEEAADSIANLDMPKIRSRPELLQLNLKLAEESFLMSALIDWRHQLADPRTKLLRAYDVCITAIETLTALTYSTPLCERFRFYDLAILGKLLDLEIPANCVSVLRACLPTTTIDARLDYALAVTICGPENVLGRTIDEGTYSNRQLLLKETYSAYRELLAGDERAIHRAEHNFARRRSDGYFAGGPQIEGGGLDNLHVIDYRLAAILKSVPFKTDSIHALFLRRRNRVLDKDSNVIATIEGGGTNEERLGAVLLLILNRWNLAGGLPNPGVR